MVNSHRKVGPPPALPLSRAPHLHQSFPLTCIVPRIRYPGLSAAVAASLLPELQSALPSPCDINLNSIMVSCLLQCLEASLIPELQPALPSPCINNLNLSSTVTVPYSLPRGRALTSPCDLNSNTISIALPDSLLLPLGLPWHHPAVHLGCLKSLPQFMEPAHTISPFIGRMIRGPHQIVIHTVEEASGALVSETKPVQRHELHQPRVCTQGAAQKLQVRFQTCEGDRDVACNIEKQSPSAARLRRAGCEASLSHSPTAQPTSPCTCLQMQPPRNPGPRR